MWLVDEGAEGANGCAADAINPHQFSRCLAIRALLG